MKLRPYQEEAVSSTFRYINGGGKAGIMALITAAGKSVIIAEICKRILTKKPHVKIMMITHVKELIEQNFKRLKAVWPHAPAGIYSAGIKRRQFGLPIIYAGIQSAYKQPALFGKVNLIMIDETHLVSDQDETMYASFIKALKEKNPDLVVIGLTATAYRQGLGCLTRGKIFDDIYFDNTKLDDFVQMIDDGYVSDLIPIDMESKFDLSNIKMSMGDFQEKSLDENLNRDEITRAIVLETLQHTKDRKKGLAFCISKSHAENMSQRFNEAGLRSTFIHDGVDKGEREERLIAFDKGEYDIICNVNVLSTGFDQPDLDYIVVARPTQSTSLHVQMLGRGMRIADGKKNCIAEGELVLTDKGLVPIEQITLDHKLWDGVEWVSHEGLIYKGEQEVITYDGLTATPDHKCWTKEGWATLQELQQRGVPLTKTGIRECEIKLSDCD